MTVAITTKPLSWHIAGEIRAEAAYQRIKASQLARKLGLSQQTFSLRYRGEVAFSTDELFQVASVLGTTPTELMARAEYRLAPGKLPPATHLESRTAVPTPADLLEHKLSCTACNSLDDAVNHLAALAAPHSEGGDEA